MKFTWIWTGKQNYDKLTDSSHTNTRSLALSLSLSLSFSKFVEERMMVFITKYISSQSCAVKENENWKGTPYEHNRYCIQ